MTPDAQTETQTTELWVRYQRGGGGELTPAALYIDYRDWCRSRGRPIRHPGQHVADYVAAVDGPWSDAAVSEMERREAGRYFVVDAPGHYGASTRVVSAHERLVDARAAAARGRYVVREGALQSGDVFWAAASDVYPVAR